ncbi:hypothetical protein G4228_004085 [Cervus hanglu yarkandensis]|nr:hypothetical protein G4228_004085 [Cervus hanglu yarkandensis]
MWNDIELLTNDDTGSGNLSVGSREEHGTALYQVDLLAKISSEKAFVQKANDENQCTYRNLVIEKDSSNEAIEKADVNTAKKGTGSCAFSKWEPDSSRKGMTVKSVIDSEIIKGAKKFQLIDNLLFVLDTEMKNLVVYSLPAMEILYSLEVSSISSLVQTGISTDTIYLLEGICKNDPSLSEDSVSVLALRCLTEALPENRLSRLLHKHRFAEAESFAIQFGLDVELVYKVKSNDILEKLALSSPDTSEQTEWQKLVNEAKENLHKIQDDEFVMNYCLEAQWITYETTQEMLNYAKTRLLKKEDKTVLVYSDGLKEDNQNMEEVCQLRTLVNNLRELITLHRKYNCKLALSDFEKEDTTTIVFRMFDKVLAPELIPSIFQKFIRVYMHEHDLQEEELLLLYIELIFDAVLKIMYAAVVPWSAAVEQLVKQHLEMDHPKVKLLQESYKLMEMKKLLRGYGIREVNLLNKEIMRVVRYILKQDVPSSLEDALKVAEAYMLPKDEIYSLRIIDLIDREQGEDCVLLLKSLPPAEAKKTAERVIIWARLALQEEPDTSNEDKAWRLSVAKTSVDILKILCNIHKDNLQKKDEWEETLKQFKTVASLQENFEVFLSFEDYSNSSLVAELREQHIKAHQVAQAKHKPRRPAEPRAAKEQRLSAESKLHRQALTLQVSRQELEAELTLRALSDGDVEAALRKCRDLFKYHCNADTGQFLFLMCQKLCHMLASGVPMTVPVGLNLPSEIHDLACQAATICSPDFLLDALELCKYTLMAVELSRQCQMDDCGILMKTSFGTHKDPYEEWSYCDFFSEDGIVLESQMVLPVIYELISSLVPLAENNRYPLDSTSLPYCFTSEGDSLILPIIDSISALLQNLQESSQWELALKFVVGSFGTCLQHSMSSFMNASLSEKVFNCRLVDLDLALGYCTLLPQKEVFENLWKLTDKAWQNYDKILISFQPVFRQHFLTKKDLIKALVKNIDMDTSVILEYCSTFQLDADAALQLFIETLLHNTNASQSQEDVSTGSTKQQRSKLLAKALEMVPLLTSTKDLVISLSGILHKLDPYDYEMIEVVLKVIERADEKITNININQALSLLKHLKSYRRISPPVDLEHQYMLEHVITLPSAAQTRLPFHLIFFGTAQSFWKILSTELSEESFPTLLLVSKLMKFSLDTLYVSTAKHVFEKKLKPKLLQLTHGKSSTMINKEIAKITQTIESYLLSIVNPEWAVAIAISLAQDVPEGSFKMSSLKFCLYLAERWLQNIPSQDETREKAEALLKKLHIQYRRSGTEAVLIAHKLNTAEYLRVIGKPVHLIVSLYEHPSINQRIQNSSGKDYPDIHTAAKEIAEVNEINLEKVWDMLLEKWLCPSAKPGEMLRMHQLTFAHRTRALQCLLYLADKETIESLFKKSIEEVKSYLKCITFLASFEALNIPITYELFCNSPKEGMIKGLWKNHSHESMAVKLVTELCLEYKIYDLQLWNGLLQKLLGFNMIPYLRKVLTAISSIYPLWQNFLGSCDPQIILQQLEEHMNTGQLAAFSHQIRSLVLKNIIDKKEFGILAKTKYFPVLKSHMINTNNITELVNYLADELSLNDASVFITEYYKHCGKPIPPGTTPCETLKVNLAQVTGF